MYMTVMSGNNEHVHYFSIESLMNPIFITLTYLRFWNAFKLPFNF